MSAQRYTAAQVASALAATKGLVYLAAKRLKCDPETVYNYCKRYPSVQAVRDAQRGQMVDLAEQKLWESIQNGEAWGISLCLKTLGKNRGYVERQEHTGSDGASLWQSAQPPAPAETFFADLVTLIHTLGPQHVNGHTAASEPPAVE